MTFSTGPIKHCAIQPPATSLRTSPATTVDRATRAALSRLWQPSRVAASACGCSWLCLRATHALPCHGCGSRCADLPAAAPLAAAIPAHLWPPAGALSCLLRLRTSYHLPACLQLGYMFFNNISKHA